MTTETKAKLNLKGRENYLEWSKRFKGLVYTEDWGTIANGVFTEAPVVKGKKLRNGFL